MRELIYIEKRKLYAEGLVTLLKKTDLFDKVLLINDAEDYFKLFKKNLNNHNTFLLIGKISQNICLFTKRVKTSFPNIKMFLVYDPSDTVDDEMLEYLLCLVDGVISVDWSIDQLRKALAYFLKEGIVAPKKLIFSFLRSLKDKMISCQSLLTKREKIILRYICSGKVNKEISNLLGIKEKTVKNHINKIYTKLGVRTRSEAIYKAFSLGVV